MSDYLHDRLVAAVGDHYLIEGELGRGGMAAVYRARDQRLHRDVAIKVLPPDLAFNASVKSRFLREAQMAARLTHPNVVPIYTVDERQGLVYFVMALIEGESLARLLRTERRLPIERVRSIVAAVADALDYAHRQGVIHRDIKPDNILIDRASGRPMVMDFGIARAAAEESRLTATGIAVGTPAYMSPEQAMGEREADGRSDLYSLGIVAYQMLAGETPFHASNTPAMLMKHVSEPPPPIRERRPDVPDSLAAAIEFALAKRPEKRWASGAEMRDAILERVSPPRRSDPKAEPRANAPAPPPARREPARIESPPRDPWLEGRLDPPPLPSARRRTSGDRADAAASRGDRVVPPVVELPERTVDERITRFRRRFASWLAVSVMLFVINAVTGGYPWFIFPVLGMMLPLVVKLGSLWGDGIPLRQVFFGPTKPAGKPVRTEPPPVVPGMTDDVLQGHHGAAVRRALASRQVVFDLLGRLTPKERAMLPPDIEPTVNALVERVASVAITLHRLDADATGGALGSLDARIAALKHDAETPDNERRLALLERQRATLRDLMERRTALLGQVESASLALENLKLDLVRFRSAGVSHALEDVTSATREARAVSRDIENLLDAQDEVRRL